MKFNPNCRLCGGTGGSIYYEGACSCGSEEPEKSKIEKIRTTITYIETDDEIAFVLRELLSRQNLVLVKYEEMRHFTNRHGETCQSRISCTYALEELTKS